MPQVELSASKGLESCWCSPQDKFGIHRAASALHRARVVLSVGEILQTCCFNRTDKVSRPLPRGGESWCDGAFSKSRVRQGAGKGQDHDPCCQYCAHMDRFQLLDGKTWSSGLTLCLERKLFSCGTQYPSWCLH